MMDFKSKSNCRLQELDSFPERVYVQTGQTITLTLLRGLDGKSAR